MVKGYLYLLTVVHIQWKHVHHIVCTNHLQALMAEIPHPHFGALAALAHPMVKFLDMFSKKGKEEDLVAISHRLVSQTLPVPGEDVLRLTLPTPVSNVGWRPGLLGWFQQPKK